MSPSDVVRNYYDCLFSGPIRPAEIRQLLSDSFVQIDPLGEASSADDLCGKLAALPQGFEMRGTVRQIIAGGDVVAALLDFQGPAGVVTYASWFTVIDGKIDRIENVYDPRSFLSAAPDGA